MRMFSRRNLSRKDRARLENAKKIASTSDCRHRHGAVTIRGGRVVAVGVNSYRNDMSQFNIVPDLGRSIHAEEACLRVVKGEASGAVLYVARVNRKGEEMMSKPCSSCMEKLKQAGVKRVVYTIDSQIRID